MKLNVNQLHEGENSLQFDSLKDGWLKEVVHRIEKQGTPLLSPLKVEAKLVKLEPDYYLKGTLEFSAQQLCARCAEAVPVTLKPEFEMAFARVNHKKATGPQLSDESDEVDINFFEGNEIDLSPVIEEQFFLSLPYQILCQESCRGICQNCGQNLNAAKCECHRAEPLSPFSVLKNFKA